MELSASQEGAIRILTVRGRLDHAHAKAFEDALAEHLGQCTPNGCPVVLDFASVAYISSVGLRVLLLAAKQVKSQNGRIAIAALTPVVTEVFQVSHFNLVLKVFATVVDAVASMRAE